MGSSASKAKRFQPAAEAGKRAIDLSVKTKHQHIRQETADPNRSQPAPMPMASQTKNEDIVRDGGDRDFARQLMDLGAVKLTESEVQYSKSNPVLEALKAREALDEAAEAESGDFSKPRTLLNPATISGILESQKAGETDITRDYNLAPGVADKLKYVSVPEYEFLETAATEGERHRDTFSLDGGREDPALSKLADSGFVQVEGRHISEFDNADYVQVGKGRNATAGGPQPQGVPGELPDDIFGDIAQAFEEQKDGAEVPKSRHQQDQDFFNREKERRYPKRDTKPVTVEL
ncbi:hypothetical protein B0I72DRAFT_142049 [Yarrowia lipolytica]|jgi:hypothetical protein|uniref:YALI0D24519p n=2 Tax=Yarrowia lipolytica TaxID=4952 RepID=Q6C7X7_YARLI|nr:YALI0D24519p [Yarrowia lipolytica CLIB122]AOW04585.1 hypothetical protein YALI1_D32435g [Yarrowia lipolytica]KAB8280236.1 hypothetical protein BKA91DRAFT_142279 [Yarrowia lipolytica]KAE8169273.1 hypothetical protein BKA90DRAFT_142933 [Yarrowia lipolytica]KAJ8053974.1 hypothetical protein LXG23DRAFT_36081 [Yarrowia lipolytica]QNP98080.1 Hypothetical protein YALI2_D00521g [Yarrowia lipolytica]|eukprot:XP_503235.1 YALI0D24519p [Yarrowia lipolytica CLIB122]